METTIFETTINGSKYSIKSHTNKLSGNTSYYVMDYSYPQLPIAIFRCTTERKAKNFLNKVQG